MAVDYYEILGISPAASLEEIKVAYRKLAHLYHPDKNPQDKSSAAYFSLVKEAYETLSNPVKKNEYLQERWLFKANGQPFETPAKTPENILLQALQAGDKIYQMDIYRMNLESVKQQLNHLLSTDNFDILNEFNETGINDAIVNELLQVIKVLPATDEQLFLQRISLIKSSYQQTINERLQNAENKLFWETWKPAFIILIVILLCILIWGTSLRN